MISAHRTMPSLRLALPLFVPTGLGMTDCAPGLGGLQSLICYWSGRLNEAVRYAEPGNEAVGRGRGTSTVWLAANQARALAALGRMAEAKAVIARAVEFRDRVEPDELDSFGGLCTFGTPRQLYYAADAFRWGGSDEAETTERYASDALDAYQNASEAEYAFSDEAGARCALAVARIRQGQIDGAAEALTTVLGLSAGCRIHGIVSSVNTSIASSLLSGATRGWSVSSPRPCMSSARNVWRFHGDKGGRSGEARWSIGLPAGIPAGRS
jgi:hypothetical protein